MTGANVARAMQLSAPTVHEMIGRLERDGYITRGADRAIAFTDVGRRARRGDRAPPPPDRALPDRRARRALGRGARGGRAPRARDVAGARGAHARRDRRRQDLPARSSDRRRRAARRRAARPTSRSAPRCAILRFENEAEDLLHYLKELGPRARPGGHARRARRRAGRRRGGRRRAAAPSPRASPRPSR